MPRAQAPWWSMSGIATFVKSQAGIKRSHNEDTYAVNPELGFFVAADGMGGAAAGEVASRIFAESAHAVFSQTTRRTAEAVADMIRDGFRLVDERILEHVKKHPSCKGMGCTAELLAQVDGGFVLGHVGDSRTYRLREGQLERLTKDHSFIQAQLDSGALTPEEARRHPLKHVLHRAVGVAGGATPDVITGTAHSKDLFLLCTDGLSDVVDDAKISAVLATDAPLSEKAESLVRTALSEGSRDDITVVLVEVKNPALMSDLT